MSCYGKNRYTVCMKWCKRIHRMLQNQSKRQIALMGFYVNFFIVMTIAMVTDYGVGNWVDAAIEAVFLPLTVLSFVLYRLTHNIEVGIYGIVILATLTTYVLLISNDFNVSIFHVIVPLGYFILFPLRRSLQLVVIHESIVIALYAYAHYHYPDVAAVQDAALMLPVGLASLMVILFGVVYHIAVENSYRQLTRANARQEILLREIHHRVKNNLNLIAALLGMQKMNSDSAEVYTLIEQNRLRLESIAMVHEMIYQQDDLEKISFETYMTRLVDHVLQTESSDHRIQIVSRMVPLVLPIDRMIYFGILLNEMVTNSIKHAFGDRDGRITLTLESDDGAACRFAYRDNGPGWKDSVGGEGFGTRVIAMSVAQLEATMEEDHRTGAGYRIVFARGCS